MLAEFFLRGPRLQRAGAWLGLLAFVAHHVFKAYLKWALNDWYADFYDTMQLSVERGSGPEPQLALAEQRAAVAAHLRAFAVLVAPACAVHPLATLARQAWCFCWRRALMAAYLARWDPARAPLEGAAQRVHEDTQRFAVGVQGAVSDVLESAFTLAIFLPILHGLDPSLAAIAAAAALGGLAVSLGVGARLVTLEVQNQVVEAGLRRDLVLLEADAPHLLGAADPSAFFRAHLRGLARNYRRLYLNFALFNTWLQSYGQAAVVLPYALVAWRLFAADDAQLLTLGAVVQTTNAFDKVFGSLNVVSDNFLALTEWRSCRRRLLQFERALDARRAHLVPAHVELSDAPPADPAPAPPPPSVEAPDHKL